MGRCDYSMWFSGVVHDILLYFVACSTSIFYYEQLNYNVIYKQSNSLLGSMHVNRNNKYRSWNVIVVSYWVAKIINQPH